MKGRAVGVLAPALALALTYALATTVGPFSDTTVNDLFVYRSYADLLAAGQLPYLDFGFEYPPLAALPLWLAGLPGHDEAAYAVSFALLIAPFVLAIQWLTARLAGTARSGATVAWLIVLAPLLVGASLRTHFDAIPIALALGGLLALAHGRAGVPIPGPPRPAHRSRLDMLAFALLAQGTMTKLFPGLLAVVAIVWLVARDERRAALRGAAIFVAVCAAISLPFAGQGYVDALRFHLDRPVQIESAPASVLFALGGSQVTGTNQRPDRFKSNGLDGGHAQAVARLFAAALAVALVGIVALAARRPDVRQLVLCGFAALLAFVALGKVFSPQYVIWLTPFAALSWVWRERLVAGLTAVAIALTQVEFPSRYFDLINERPRVIVIVAVRNALLLTALVMLTAALSRTRDRADDRSRRQPHDRAGS